MTYVLTIIAIVNGHPEIHGSAYYENFDSILSCQMMGNVESRLFENATFTCEPERTA